MLVTASQLEERFNLDSAFVNSALCHQGCPYYTKKGDNEEKVFYKFEEVWYEESEAIEAIRSYFKYKEETTAETLLMWKQRLNRFENMLERK